MRIKLKSMNHYCDIPINPNNAYILRLLADREPNMSIEVTMGSIYKIKTCVLLNQLDLSVNAIEEANNPNDESNEQYLDGLRGLARRSVG